VTHFSEAVLVLP